MDRMSLRFRLLLTTIGSILVLFLLVLFGARHTLQRDLHAFAETQVNAGADAFQSRLQMQIDQTRSIVASAAAQTALGSAIARRDGVSLRPMLQTLQQPNGFSFVSIVDARGKVVVRANGLDIGSISNEAVSEALHNRIASGVTHVGRAELEGEYLDRDVEPLHDAVAVAAAAPVTAGNRVVGVLYAGTLLSGEGTLVRDVAKFTGGQTAVVLGNTVMASSTPLPSLGAGYESRLEPVKTLDGSKVSLWFGVPSAQFAAIADNTSRSVVLWCIVGLLIAVGIAVVLAERIARALARRSDQVAQSVKELGVLVIGSEVSNDHVVETRRKLEALEKMLHETEKPADPDGRRVQALATEAHADVIVIDALAGELNARMSQAHHRVTELNDVARALNALVKGNGVLN